MASGGSGGVGQVKVPPPKVAEVTMSPRTVERRMRFMLGKSVRDPDTDEAMQSVKNRDEITLRDPFARGINGGGRDLLGVVRVMGTLICVR